MAGALGCFASLIIVGSLIAAYGDDWPSHPVAGRVAIGETIPTKLGFFTEEVFRTQLSCISTTSTSRIHGHLLGGVSTSSAFRMTYVTNTEFWLVLPSEIFPLALRSTGISITTSCTWMSNL